MSAFTRVFRRAMPGGGPRADIVVPARLVCIAPFEHGRSHVVSQALRERTARREADVEALQNGDRPAGLSRLQPAAIATRAHAARKAHVRDLADGAGAAVQAHHLDEAIAMGIAVVHDARRPARRSAERRGRQTYAGAAHRGIARKWLADRKSTRLNSSHVAISYAVFCLKKKKKTNTQILPQKKKKKIKIKT